MKHQTDQFIHSYETNRFGNASLSSIFGFLIEIAWEHAKHLNWGFEELKDNNLFWVLSRIYIQIEKYPKWQDEITIHTWTKGTDGMYAYREFEIINGHGETIVRASSAWLILELDTKRIFRLAKYIKTFPSLQGGIEFRKPVKIKAPEKPKIISFQPVQFTELDVNQHFNSVRYMERALNDFGIEFLNQNEVAEIELNYLKEGLAEDSLGVVRKNIGEKLDTIAIVRESDLAELCTMQIHWKSRN